MFTKENLKRMEFATEDIDFIIDLHSRYSHKIEPLVKEYIADMKEELFVPYKDGERDVLHQKAILYAENIRKNLSELNPYSANLLGWLNCVPYLAENYKKYGISEDIFYDLMKDFSYKVRECKDVYGTLGVFAEWFFLFLDLKLFALGRLQYEISTFIYDKYSSNGFELKKGDVVYSCHIPSSGKLTTVMCMESFQKAYEFFKPQLQGNIIPIVCKTWILYKPYAGRVFTEESNVGRFIKLFDVVDSNSTGQKFDDSWRVFNKDYEGKTDDLPCDNTLRRNLINYINGGGDFGTGYGIILYNGETKEIVDKPSDFIK